MVSIKLKRTFVIIYSFLLFVKVTNTNSLVILFFECHSCVSVHLSVPTMLSVFIGYSSVFFRCILRKNEIHNGFNFVKSVFFLGNKEFWFFLDEIFGCWSLLHDSLILWIGFLLYKFFDNIVLNFFFFCVCLRLLARSFDSKLGPRFKTTSIHLQKLKCKKTNIEHLSFFNLK